MEKEMRITPDEIKVIRDTFKGNQPLLKVLRKIFLPSYDPNAPLGQTVDLWMGIETQGKTDAEIARNTLVREQLIRHVESQLIQLDFLAKSEEETEEQKIARQKKDSTK